MNKLLTTLVLGRFIHLTLFLIFPLTYLLVDVFLRADNLERYSVNKSIFYSLSVFQFFIFYVLALFLIRIVKKKPFQLIVSFLIGIYIILTIVCSYFFHHFNGFFPNFYTFEYFIHEPLSAFVLIHESISFTEFVGLILIWSIISFLFYKVAKQAVLKINKSITFILLISYFCFYTVLMSDFKKYDQCLIVDVNFVAALSKHLLNRESNRNFKGKGLEAHHGEEIPTIQTINKPNVLIVIFESLRKQNLQVYGYGRNTTPNLARFKKENSTNFYQFQHPYTVSSTTMLGVPAILTGIAPCQSKQVFYKQPFIWSYAKELGYFTFLLSSHTLKWYRFDRFYGKENLDLLWNKDNSKIPFYNDLGIKDELTTSKLNSLISTSKDPFFGVVQYNTTHYPYKVEPHEKKWNGTFQDEYDNSILKQDREIGKVLNHLKKTGKLKNTIVVFVSDHGESLKDHHNIGHVDNYYAQTISIPLMFYFPSQLLSTNQKSFLKANFEKNVSNIDIVPTLLDVLSLSDLPALKKITSKLIGKSLCKPISEKRFIITQNNNGMARFRVGLSVIKGDLHYLLKANVNPIIEEVYNIKRDVKEEVNIIRNTSEKKLLDLKNSFNYYPISKEYYSKYIKK